MKKYRLFGIINPIDVLLVTMVVVLVWGAYMLAQPQTVVAEDGRLIRFTFELINRTEGFHETIELGNQVFCGATGWLVGNIVEVYAGPFYADTADEEAGIIRRVPVPERESTFVVIEARAQICDYATSVGYFWVAANRQVGLRSRDFGGQGFISRLEWLD